MFNNSLWDWKLGLQREGLLYSQGEVCCGLTSKRHSFLTTPYGVGSLDFRGKVCCIVKGRFAVESRVRDTHALTTPYAIGSLDFRGKVCCIVR